MTADTGTQHRLLTPPPSPEVQLDPRQPAVPTNAWATSPEHPVNGVQTQGDPMRPQTPRSRGGQGAGLSMMSALGRHTACHGTRTKPEGASHGSILQEGTGRGK